MADSVIAENSPKVTDTRRKTVTLAVIVLSNFCAVCCMSLMAPFYAIEAAKKGVSLTVVGIIYSSSELVTFLTSPVFGHMLSKYNPRPFYIAGLCLFGACDIIFGCLDKLPPGTPFIVACFIVRSVEALGTSAVMTASFTIAGFCFPERVATVFSVLRTAVGIALMIGPALGGALYQLGGYGLPFWVLGSCTFVCGGASCLLLPHQEAKLVPSKQSLSGVGFFRSTLVWFGILSIFSSQFGICSLFPFYAQHLLQFNLNQGIIGVIFMAAPTAYTVAVPLWGHLLDRNVPAVPSLCMGMCCLSISYLFFGPAPFLRFVPTVLWLTILMSAFIGFFFAPVTVSSVKNIFQEARNMGLEDDGALFGPLAGVIQSATYFGNFTGPLAGGILVQHYGFPWTMTACSIFIMITFLAFVPFLLIGLWNKSKLKNVIMKNYLELN
ncbi:MFS-type transporter SLC18B1-like [Haliotis rufescens]|uniref:MFS-type transporter SLC18B1-like n=1 Tax=Haliotis rufescens TaxID=6454 RepID=UPI00201E79FD|nr:MFS-type transporter SLC18B1-like [Haliotis rufescens]